MILGYLHPDPSPLDAATVLVRAALYAATLGAAGLGLFLAAAARVPAAGALAGMGALLACASHAAPGHSTLYTKFLKP